MNKKILLLTITVCFLLAGCAKEGMPQQIGQSSSAPTITSSAVPSESAASSTSTISNSSNLSAQLKSILAKYTTNRIVFFQSITIGDNQNAAFAITINDNQNAAFAIVYGGDVWYITAFGAQKLKNDIAFSADDQSLAPLLWTVGDVKIFKCESTAWYVKDGKPVELPYTGMNLSYSSKTESFNEKNLSDFSYGGIYQATLFPKIVTYPDKFLIN